MPTPKKAQRLAASALAQKLMSVYRSRFQMLPEQWHGSFRTIRDRTKGVQDAGRRYTAVPGRQCIRNTVELHHISVPSKHDKSAVSCAADGRRRRNLKRQRIAAPHLLVEKEWQSQDGRVPASSASKPGAIELLPDAEAMQAGTKRKSATGDALKTWVAGKVGEESSALERGLPCAFSLSRA
ncbi:hypothetical protein EJ04DRAFT_326590 [Polyplosphaeria fusca]|uniref:Uncharacterized protein n=1 Tax=Polyplosphaeria fusca TaxID=682080 RepID=A0A9P4R9P8_9PLEO|nr:hypothetical protein EJ04DRAFT_326590 [Polyplosphaeria fusca]